MIRRGSAVASATQPSGQAPTASIIDIPRVLTALGIVVGLIFALRYLAKRFIPGIPNARSTSAVRLLGRSMITPKHQVLLLQVGRRIMVAADNGTQLTPLGEIHDPEEVALVLGQLDASKQESISSAFGALVSGARERFMNQTPAAFEPLSQSQNLSDDARADNTVPAPDDPGARSELTNLMNKVRLLSQQFRRTSS